MNDDTCKERQSKDVGDLSQNKNKKVWVTEFAIKVG